MKTSGWHSLVWRRLLLLGNSFAVVRSTPVVDTSHGYRRERTIDQMAAWHAKVQGPSNPSTVIGSHRQPGYPRCRRKRSHRLFRPIAAPARQNSTVLTKPVETIPRNSPISNQGLADHHSRYRGDESMSSNINTVGRTLDSRDKPPVIVNGGHLRQRLAWVITAAKEGAGPCQPLFEL